MKHWIVLLLSLSVLVSGCARFKGRGTNPSSAAPPVASTLTESPTPDFTSMNFVERNNLYLQLLDEKQAASVDTNQAEEAYVRSMEASFAGNSKQADQYLQEAILLLWNQ